MDEERRNPHLRSNSFLDLALRAEKWIDSTRLETEVGIAWPVMAEESGQIAISLYHGTSGILLFYLELFETTGDPVFLERASRGADDLLARVADAHELTAGLYQGLAGLAFSLAEVARRTSDDGHLIAAEDCLERLRSNSTRQGTGVGWIEPIPFAESFGVSGVTEVWDVSRGSAGVGLGLLYAHRWNLFDDALAIATQIGDRLLEVAQATDSGLQWQMMAQDVRWTAPNFAHGTAGIAYFLARLFQETDEQRFLEAALEGASHLRTIATPTENGHLIYHHERSGEDLFYLAWCHGPAGTGRLFHLLSKVVEDPSWMNWLTAGVVGVLETGVPEERTPGFWNNVSQCCGDAGVGELGLSLYEATKDDRFLDLGQRIGSVLEHGGTEAADGLCWIQAEQRVQPEFVRAQTGYMQGAAGIGSYFLRLHSIEEGEEPKKIPFPDSPFGPPPPSPIRST